MKDIEKYIEDGIVIHGNPKDGYRVFTIPTQHFKITSLSELTPETFERARKNWVELEDMQGQMLRSAFPSFVPDFSEYLRTDFETTEKD